MPQLPMNAHDGDEVNVQVQDMVARAGGSYVIASLSLSQLLSLVKF